MRRALERTPTGYAWNDQADVGPIAPHPHPEPITAPHLPVVRPSQSLDDLLATIHEPVPESVVSTFMGQSSADIRRLVADAVPENAAHSDDLLRKAQESDAEVARAPAGASFAGEPEPYRTPAEDADARE